MITISRGWTEVPGMVENGLLFFFLFALLGAGTLWYGRLEGAERRRAWQDAAVACGLQATEVPTTWRLPPKAGAGWAEVRILPCGKKGRDARIVLKGPGPPDFEKVRIRPESLLQWERENAIGDAAFDRIFFIEGPARPVLALLDVETRRLLLRLSFDSQPEIHLGEIRAQMANTKVPELLPLLLDIGRSFARPMGVPERLAENAHHDPEAEVRLQNLLVLIREFPGEPQTVKALRTSCLDTHPQIRLRAARELGAEGHEVLLKIAEGLADDTVSAEAVSILDRALPFERACALLDRARSSRSLQTARSCLEGLGRSGDPAAAGVLAQVMALEKGELAADAARALGETGNPDAEPLLIPALQREERSVRMAAANALGRVGSVAAVLPLKEMDERHRLDFDLSRAVHQAVGEIQARLQGASPGQLSLAQAEAGHLSLSTDPAGQLSLSGDGDKPGEDGSRHEP